MSLTKQIMRAADEMGIEPDQALVTTGRDQTPTGEGSWHRHVAIEWEGGVIWLDMSEQSDHFCVDVRSFNAGQRVPIGVFSISEGRRVQLDDREVPADSRLEVHGWPATRMPIMLIDKPDTRTAEALRDAGWPAVAEDFEAGVPANVIMRRLSDAGEQGSDAYAILADVA